MRAWHQPHVRTLTIGVILVLALGTFAVFGLGGMLVFALAGLLVGNYLAHRAVAAQPNEFYPPHGDNMD
jgi:hypothetical protein